MILTFKFPICSYFHASCFSLSDVSALIARVLPHDSNSTLTTDIDLGDPCFVMPPLRLSIQIRIHLSGTRDSRRLAAVKDDLVVH